jgi:hypothetical protein
MNTAARTAQLLSRQHAADGSFGMRKLLISAR